MSGRVLHLAPRLSVPADQFVESATFLIGKRSSGKSGGVKVIEEELFRVGLPFITLDPVGVHWGIRSGADGKSPGLPVLVIGGSHGDVRLDRRAGAETARAILEANVSCIIDFSEEPKSAYREFVRDFARELYAKNQTPRIVIVEEAPELVPQKVQGDRAETFEAVERLVSRGRNKGLGFVGVSQRAATINKDVLTQADNLFIGRLVSPQDRKALAEWVEAWDVKDRLGEFTERLASLPTRTMYLWSPEALKEFKPVRFRDFETLHGDRTHLNRLGLLQAQPVTTDVSSVVEKLGKQLERLHKEKDESRRTPVLEREITRLKEQLALQVAKPAAVVADPKAVERAVAERDRFWQGRMAKVSAAALRVATAKESFEQAIDTAIRHLTEAAGYEAPPKPADAKPYTLPAPSRSTTVSPPELRGTGVKWQEAENDGHLYSGEKRILGELASRSPLKLTRAQLATLVGMSAKGGTFTTYVGRLKRFGMLSEENREVTVTRAGIEAAGEVPAAPSSHEEVMARWKRSLYSGCYRLLEIVDANPQGIGRQELADLGEMTPSGGTFTTYVGILKRNGLVTEEDHRLRPGPGLAL